MVAFRQIRKSLRNIRKSLNRMIGDLMGETVDTLVEFGCYRVDGEFLESCDQRVRKTLEAVSRSTSLRISRTCSGE